MLESDESEDEAKVEEDDLPAQLQPKQDTLQLKPPCCEPAEAQTQDVPRRAEALRNPLHVLLPLPQEVGRLDEAPSEEAKAISTEGSLPKIPEAQTQATRSSLERVRISAKALCSMQRPPAAETEPFPASTFAEEQVDAPQSSPGSKDEV